MSQNWETFLRALGVVVAYAVLTYVAQATNINTVVSPNLAAIISGLAATLLAVWDKLKSPAGTVVFGTVGVQK